MPFVGILRVSIYAAFEESSLRNIRIMTRILRAETCHATQPFINIQTASLVTYVLILSIKVHGIISDLLVIQYCGSHNN